MDVQIRVICARSLPKTDRFSKIDPYVKIIVNNAVKMRTSTKDDNDNPVYNEVFFFETLIGQGNTPAARIEFELWDRDSFKDKKIGHAYWDTAGLSPQQLKHVQLPLSFTKEKYAKWPSTLEVAIDGWVLSYPTLRSALMSVPGAIFDDSHRRLYVPVPGYQGVVYLSVEYEKTCVDNKVYITSPNAELFCDMSILDRKKTKIIRRMHPQGKQVGPGIIAYEEIKLDDVPLSTDFNKVYVFISERQTILSMSLVDVVRSHGWHGSLNFSAACRTLHNIEVDHNEEEIYMSVYDSPYPDTFLVVDWDDTDVDIKLAVLDHPQANDKGYDLTLWGQPCKKDSEIFSPPKPILGGKYRISRIYELDDVRFGTAFANMRAQKYQLRNTRSFSVQSIVRLQ